MSPQNEHCEASVFHQNLNGCLSKSDGQAVLERDLSDEIETYLATISIIDNSFPSCSSSSCEDWSFLEELEPSIGHLPDNFGAEKAIGNFVEPELAFPETEKETAAQQTPLPPLKPFSLLLEENEENRVDYNQYIINYLGGSNNSVKSIANQETSDQSTSKKVVLPGFQETFVAKNEPKVGESSEVNTPIIRKRTLARKFFSFVNKNNEPQKIKKSRTLIKLLDLVQKSRLQLASEGKISSENTKYLLHYITKEINASERSGRFRLLKYNRRKKTMVVRNPRHKFIYKRYKNAIEGKDEYERDRIAKEKAREMAKAEPTSPIASVCIPKLNKDKVVTIKKRDPRIRKICEPLHHFLLRRKMEVKMKSSPVEVRDIIRKKKMHSNEKQITISELEAIYVRFGMGRIFNRNEESPAPT